MTTLEARVEGCRANLDHRGHDLTLVRTDTAYRALLREEIPNQGEFSVGRETAVGTVVHLLKDDLGPEVILIGDVFFGGGNSYRVTKVEEAPNDLWCKCTCDVSRES